MSSLLFLVPVNGRFALTKACLRTLRWTCDQLYAIGVDASAVVMGDDANLAVAQDLGFGTVVAANVPLGRKWNDGYQLATDPELNPRPADWVMPIGSDDWIDPKLVLTVPTVPADTIVCFKQAAFVSDDGKRLSRCKITYEGGVGLRLIPSSLVAKVGYRPADESKNRALDTSTLKGLRRRQRVNLVYHDLHPLQVVDFKTKSSNLNPYKACQTFCWEPESTTPWDDLARHYPQASIDEVRAVYA